MGENETSYKGTIVSTDVAEELQKKPIADFLHFEKGPKGNMIMTAKLPEWGRMGDKDFRIRENMNYFVRGLVTLTLDENGNINTKNADENLEALHAPLLNNKVPADFLDACGVPKDRRDDFNAFVSFLGPELGTLRDQFLEEMERLKVFQYNLLRVEDDDLKATREALLEDSYQDFRNILNFYRQMAAMDPQKETNPMFFMGGSHYAGLNVRLRDCSNNYHRSRGEAELKGERYTIKLPTIAKEEEDKGNFNKLDAQNCFITEIEINKEKKILSIETQERLPLGKLLSCPKENRVGTGIYDSEEALKDFHSKDNVVRIPDTDKFVACREPKDPKADEMATIAPSESFELRLRQNSLRKMFRENVKIIQKTIPEFTITDEEIEKYISPERIALHDRAVKLTQEYAKYNKSAPYLPKAFSRLSHVLTDKSGTPEAKKRSEKEKQLYTDPGAEGENFRRQTFADIANRVQTIDAGAMSPDKPLNEQLAYVFDNMDTFEMGAEFENVQSGIHSMGFIIPPEQQQNNLAIKKKAVELGGYGKQFREMACSGCFLTCPFDMLTNEQAMKLASQEKYFKTEPLEEGVSAHSKLLGLVTSFNDRKENWKSHDNVEKHHYTAEEFSGKLPSVDFAKQRFSAIYTDLKNENGWNSWNSGKYKNLLKALKTLNGELSGAAAGNYTRPDEGGDLAKSIQNVAECAREYIQHVGAVPKNDRQKHRLDLAKAAVANAALLQDPVNGLKPFIEKINADAENATEDYYAAVKDKSGYGYDGKTIDTDAPKPEKMSKETWQETLFRTGAERTEKLRTETEELEKKGEGDLADAEKQLLDADRRALDARDELTNMVGRTEIDREKAKPLLATVMMTTLYKQALKNSQKVGDIDGYIKDTLNSAAFDTVTDKLTGEKINEFLAGPGEIAMLKKFNELGNSKKRDNSQEKMQMDVPEETNITQEGKEGPKKGPGFSKK